MLVLTIMHAEAAQAKQNVSIGLIEIFYWRLKQIPIYTAF